MNRKNFLKTFAGILSIPFVSVKAEEPKKDVDKLKLSHLYEGAYAGPNDLWTPEEITEAGFVFVDSPSITHKFDDLFNPIMRYVMSDDPNLKPILLKTSRFCNACYIKTYDLDKGRVRGIESVADYLRKKDIFKPMIVEWMKKMEYHYVYKVVLEDSPITWIGKFGDGDMIFHRHAVNVRGARLPKRI